MRHGCLIVLIAPLALACAKGGAPVEPSSRPASNAAPAEQPDTPSGAEAVETLESLAQRMCACDDVACANATMRDLMAEAEELADTGTTGTHDDVRRAGRASERATTCFIQRGGDREEVIALASLRDRLPPRLTDAITMSAVVQHGDDEAVELERLAEVICACADKACVETEFDPFVAYVKQLQANNATGSETNIERAGNAAEKAVNCYQEHGGDPQKLMELANAVQ